MTLRPVSPVLSTMSDVSEAFSPEETSRRSPSDSSLLIKVTIRDGTVLAGRPTVAKEAVKKNRNFRRSRQISFAVVQVLSNALIMFQSVENHDASGTTTLHISLDDLSASVNTEFVRIPTSELPPMIGPTGAEFRVASGTENLGTVVSKDFSFDCEHLKSSLTPNDLSIFVGIVSTMLQRLQGVHDFEKSPEEKAVVPTIQHSTFSLLTYQKRGTGIATNIRMQLHAFSFVVLRDFQTKFGAPEFLALNVTSLKARLGGCMSALSGDCNACISVEFFNAEVSDWEYAVETFPMTISIDQMPNELIFELTTTATVQINLTGIFLRDIAELDFDSFKKDKPRGKLNALTPSALSTVGLRRATESHSVKISNLTGLDIDVAIADSAIPSTPGFGVHFDSVGPGLIKHNCCVSLDSVFDGVDFQSNLDRLAETSSKLTLKLPPSSVALVGAREVVTDLPVTSPSGRSVSLHVLKPVVSPGSTHPRSSPTKQTSNPGADPGRSSPETVFTEMSRAADYAYYHAEPVVEWCMQNQRLASNTIDLYSLEKGRDLLSISIWSPEQDYNIVETVHQSDGISADREEPEAERHLASSSSRSNWLRPYLKNDSPEFTDHTTILRMARERVMLPDNSWMWANDWKIDISGDLGETTDADGWEYQADFETFTRNRRFYVRGDACRRRRWTRTRMVRPPRLEDPNRILKFVWETSRDESGNFKIEVKSHITLHNDTSSQLTFFVYSPSWDEEMMIGSATPGGKVNVPVRLASAVYLRIAKRKTNEDSSSLQDYDATSRIMMIPTSYKSNVWIRSSMKLGDVSATHLHFLLNISCKKGIVVIRVRPVLKVLNLLPCQLECHLGEVCRPDDKRQVDPRPVTSGSVKRHIANVETLNVASGNDGKCIALNPASKPHISFRVPGYKWSSWQRIVNRRADSCTWRPSEAEEDFYLGLNKEDGEHADEFKLLVYFDRLGMSGDPLILIMSVESGHCPTVRIYAQYWIVDKTGFGCHFCESFTDLLGTTPEVECSRRSHLLQEDSRDQGIKRDMNIQGHQWSMGMSGMSMYFSIRERIALSIESGAGDGRYANTSIKSKWTSPMDVSNVMPKTVFSVDELGGPRRFELAISVTVCPGVFSRTRMITLMPRYQIVNLLKRELVIAQDGCLKAETLIPSQSAVPFHLEKGSLPCKVRLGAPTTEERDSGDFEDCWTNGRIELDKVGITSMRFPTSGILPAKPMVVQAEVRLATKDQSSAVVIVLWSANEKSNPLYLLRNRTSHTILCRQPLQDEQGSTGKDSTSTDLCGTKTKPKKKSPNFHCGAELAPIVRSFLGLDRIEEFVWVLHSGDTACFGFDDPEKPHILEWACVDAESLAFDDNCAKAFVEIDAMGSWSNLSIGEKNEVRCQIGAEHSTKVVEFVEKPSTKASRSLIGSSLKNRSMYNELLVAEEERAGLAEEDDEVSFTLRVNVPTLCVSVIDNANPDRHGREILLVQFDNIFSAFSQSREGYHEIELRLMSLQVDNHVPASIHPILVSTLHRSKAAVARSMFANHQSNRFSTPRSTPRSRSFTFRPSAGCNSIALHTFSGMQLFACLM